MNIVFYILLFAVVAILWVLLSGLFPLIGKFISSLSEEVKHNINR